MLPSSAVIKQQAREIAGGNRDTSSEAFGDGEGALFVLYMGSKRGVGVRGNLLIADGTSERAIAPALVYTELHSLVVVGLHEHQLRTQFSADEPGHGAPDPLEPRMVVGCGDHAFPADGHWLVRELRPIPEKGASSTDHQK